MDKRFRPIANDAPQSTLPSPEDRLPSILRNLDDLRVKVRNLERERDRYARLYANSRGEFLLPGEARLRCELRIAR